MTRAAEAGSFSRAARLLQLDPSAISHAVTELEKDLGLRLFHRTTRQLSLTEEGHEVLRRARTMLLDMTEIQNLSSRTRQRLEGTLRIGMSIAVSQHVVMPRMAEFLQRHPDVRVESLILNEPKDMHAASLDVMFHSGNPRDSELVAKRIGASSDEAGQGFRSITGHPFRFHSGRDSDLKPATLGDHLGRC